MTRRLSKIVKLSRKRCPKESRVFHKLRGERARLQVGALFTRAIYTVDNNGNAAVVSAA